MISKNRQKFLRSLQQKKNRKANKIFLVEGEKSVKELLQSKVPIEQLVCSEFFFQKNDYLVHAQGVDCEVVSPDILTQISSLTTNTSAVAVLPFFEDQLLSWEEEEYLFLLDNLQDPGNLGAIIRIADWYGIHKIICSPESVDLYNPKVIAASMGSFIRVRLHYTPLREYFRAYPEMPVYGALLEGDNIHEVKFAKTGGGLLLGNESQGISQGIQPFIHHRVSIPRFGQAESLNVAMATAVIADNLRRTVPLKDQ